MKSTCGNRFRVTAASHRMHTHMRVNTYPLHEYSPNSHIIHIASLLFYCLLPGDWERRTANDEHLNGWNIQICNGFDARITWKPTEYRTGGSKDIQNREEQFRNVVTRRRFSHSIREEKRKHNELFSINSFTAWRLNVGLASTQVAPCAITKLHRNNLMGPMKMIYFHLLCSDFRSNY